MTNGRLKKSSITSQLRWPFRQLLFKSAFFPEVSHWFVNRCLIVLFTSCVALSCSKDPDVKTRSFYMGFTPFPYEISLEAVDAVYTKLDTEADIINHHFDNGVPWVEA